MGLAVGEEAVMRGAKGILLAGHLVRPGKLDLGAIEAALEHEVRHVEARLLDPVDGHGKEREGDANPFDIPLGDGVLVEAGVILLGDRGVVRIWIVPHCCKVCKEYLK